jgi:hypothetical protein
MDDACAHETPLSNDAPLDRRNTGTTPKFLGWEYPSLLRVPMQQARDLASGKSEGV